MWPKYYGIIYEYHVTDTSGEQFINNFGQPQYVHFTRATFVKKWSSSNLKSPVYKRYVFKWHKTNVFYWLIGVWPNFWKNLNLAYNFLTMSARGLIFHMNIPCDKTLPWGTNIVYLCLWHLSLTFLLKTLTLLINVEQCAKVLIFQISISCDMTLAWGTNIWYRVTWSLRFNRFT